MTLVGLWMFEIAKPSQNVFGLLSKQKDNTSLPVNKKMLPYIIKGSMIPSSSSRLRSRDQNAPQIIDIFKPQTSKRLQLFVFKWMIPNL